MRMVIYGWLALSVLLSACATVTDTQRQTITVAGVNYTTVTRTFEQSGRTSVTGDVLFNGVTYGCDTSTPGACEAVVEKLRRADTTRSVDSVIDSSSFIIPGMN